MAEALDKRTATLIAEVDPTELAVAMCEASYGIRRPAGSTARQALDAMEPESREGWIRAAHAATELIAAAINKACRVQ